MLTSLISICNIYLMSFNYLLIMLYIYIYILEQISSQRPEKAQLVGGKGRGKYVQSGSMQIQLDRQRRHPLGPQHSVKVPRPCRPSQDSGSHQHSPPGITMILTPGFMPSLDSDQRYEGHMDNVPGDDDINPKVEELERDEEVVEEIAEEAARAANPRGELAQFVHAVPRSQWPRDSNGKYFLEWVNGM